MSLTNLRKLLHLVGTVIPAAMLFAVSQVDSDRKYLIIALITVALSLPEVTNVAGFGSILMEIAPNYMGILQGINNSLGLAPDSSCPSSFQL